MSCHQNGPLLVDTCAVTQGSPTFNVDVGEVVFLSACDIPAGVVLPISTYVGVASNGGCLTPFAQGGSQMALAMGNPQVIITTPGTYMIDLSAIPDGVCVKVAADEYKLSDLGCCPPMVFPEPPLVTVPMPACTVESIIHTFEGPGFFSSDDLNATGRLISASITAVTDGVTITGSTGESATLRCGDVKGWQEILDHATETYCTLAPFDIELADGEVACVVAQAII